MKLTTYIRKAFVSSAMNDVPKVDYEQKVRDAANKMRIQFLKAHGIEKADQYRLIPQTLWLSGSMSNMIMFGLTQAECKKIADTDLIKGLCTDHDKQRTARSELEGKLEAIASSVNTSKQLIELLPEFEKYLPEEPAKMSNLPAVSNVMGEFIRAGWPKDKQKAATA